jgi:hypothetical protein
MIQGRRDHVAETCETVQSLLMSGDPEDARLAAVVALLVLEGREGGHSQIFLLSPPRSEETLMISHPIQNTRTGPGNAWIRGHRYVPETGIMSEPRTTDELDERMTVTPRSCRNGVWRIRYPGGYALPCARAGEPTREGGRDRSAFGHSAVRANASNGLRRISWSMVASSMPASTIRGRKCSVR